MYAHIRHIIWICVLLLRRWPSGEPDNSCTRDIVMDACSLDCVRAQTFSTICHARPVIRLSPLPPARAGLRAAPTPDTYPLLFLFHFAFDSLRGCG